MAGRMKTGRAVKMLLIGCLLIGLIRTESSEKDFSFAGDKHSYQDDEDFLPMDEAGSGSGDKETPTGNPVLYRATINITSVLYSSEIAAAGRNIERLAVTQQIQEAIQKLLDSLRGTVRIRIVEFNPGSLMVTFDIDTDGQQTEEEIVQLLKDALNSGNLNGFSVSPASFDFQKIRESDSLTCAQTVGRTPSDLPTESNNWANLMITNTFPCNGYVTGWNYYRKIPFGYGYAGVFRQISETEFVLIGKTRLPDAAVGAVTVTVDTPILVQRGDFIGVFYEERYPDGVVAKATEKDVKSGVVADSHLFQNFYVSFRDSDIAVNEPFSLTDYPGSSENRVTHAIEAIMSYENVPSVTDERTTEIAACTASQWTCKNGDCIDATYYCDQQVDCYDGSDEENCPVQPCPNDEFQCANKELCLPQEFVCNFVNDCSDKSDEVDCPPPPVRIDSFRDGSDPNTFLLSWLPPRDGGLAILGYVIRYRKIQVQGERTEDGDYIIERPLSAFSQLDVAADTTRYSLDGLEAGGYYEVVVAARNSAGLSEQPSFLLGTASVGCRPGEWQCISGGCITLKQRCDAFPDCDDGSDEDSELCRPTVCNEGLQACPQPDGSFTCVLEAIGCAARCLPNEFLCLDETRCIDFRRLCDGVNDCADLSDEANCECADGEFQCVSDRRCLNDQLRCDSRRDCNDGSDEANCPCPAGNFQCTNTPSQECVDKRLMCDGYQDCSDGSDEADCGCPEGQWQCADRNCIPESLRCDGQPQCEDSSDEVECGCRDDQFTCDDRNCIELGMRCDQVKQCEDGSDENNCPCPDGMFQCADSNCVEGSMKCDGVPQCEDQSDEVGCPPRNCPTGDFQCVTSASPGRLDCIDGRLRCDGYDDCTDGSDERDCPGCRRDEFECESDGKCLPASARCNSAIECSDRSDELKCSCNVTQFRCGDGICIDARRRCDRRVDCDDQSDELACPCQSGQFQCVNGDCIDATARCNGQPDCSDRSDEDDCPTDRRRCPDGFYQCKSGHCLTENRHCDGYPDCPDGDDEDKDDCPLVCDSEDLKCEIDNKCLKPEELCNRVYDCSDGHDEVDTCSPCREDEFQCTSDRSCISRAGFCNQIKECADGSDEMNCPVLPQVSLVVSPKNLRIRMGVSALLTCFATGLPLDAKVTWSRAGLGLPMQSAVENGKLMIPIAKVMDSGNYVCTVEGVPGNIHEVAKLEVVAIGPTPEPEPSGPCSRDEAVCQNGQCIRREYRCDGEPDCTDGSDEPDDCYSNLCEPNEFRCPNGQCVMKIWRCDGENDCSDGFDEQNCRARGVDDACATDEFQCVSGDQCVPFAYQCDQEIDCLDRSDEIGCSPPIITIPPVDNVEVELGGAFTIICEAVGVPTPLIVWRLNWGNLFAGPDRATIVNEDGRGTLTIVDAQYDDAGAYTCEAINNRGSIFAIPDALVIVRREGVPITSANRVIISGRPAVPEVATTKILAVGGTTDIELSAEHQIIVVGFEGNCKNDINISYSGSVIEAGCGTVSKGIDIEYIGGRTVDFEITIRRIVLERRADVSPEPTNDVIFIHIGGLPDEIKKEAKQTKVITGVTKNQLSAERQFIEVAGPGRVTYQNQRQLILIGVSQNCTGVLKLVQEKGRKVVQCLTNVTRNLLIGASTAIKKNVTKEQIVIEGQKKETNINVIEKVDSGGSTTVESDNKHIVLKGGVNEDVEHIHKESKSVFGGGSFSGEAKEEIIIEGQDSDYEKSTTLEIVHSGGSTVAKPIAEAKEHVAFGKGSEIFGRIFEIIGTNSASVKKVGVDKFVEIGSRSVCEKQIEVRVMGSRVDCVCDNQNISVTYIGSSPADLEITHETVVFEGSGAWDEIQKEDFILIYTGGIPQKLRTQTNKYMVVTGVGSTQLAGKQQKSRILNTGGSTQGSRNTNQRQIIIIGLSRTCNASLQTVHISNRTYVQCVKNIIKNTVLEGNGGLNKDIVLQRKDESHVLVGGIGEKENRHSEIILSGNSAMSQEKAMQSELIVSGGPSTGREPSGGNLRTGSELIDTVGTNGVVEKLLHIVGTEDVTIVDKRNVIDIGCPEINCDGNFKIIADANRLTIQCNGTEKAIVLIYIGGSATDVKISRTVKVLSGHKSRMLKSQHTVMLYFGGEAERVFKERTVVEVLKGVRPGMKASLHKVMGFGIRDDKLVQNILEIGFSSGCDGILKATTENEEHTIVCRRASPRRKVENVMEIFGKGADVNKYNNSINVFGKSPITSETSDHIEIIGNGAEIVERNKTETVVEISANTPHKSHKQENIIEIFGHQPAIPRNTTILVEAQHSDKMTHTIEIFGNSPTTENKTLINVGKGAVVRETPVHINQTNIIQVIGQNVGIMEQNNTIVITGNTGIQENKTTIVERPLAKHDVIQKVNLTGSLQQVTTSTPTTTMEITTRTTTTTTSPTTTTAPQTRRRIEKVVLVSKAEYVKVNQLQQIIEAGFPDRCSGNFRLHASRHNLTIECPNSGNEIEIGYINSNLTDIQIRLNTRTEQIESSSKTEHDKLRIYLNGLKHQVGTFENGIEVISGIHEIDGGEERVIELEGYNETSSANNIVQIVEIGFVKECIKGKLGQYLTDDGVFVYCSRRADILPEADTGDVEEWGHLLERTSNTVAGEEIASEKIDFQDRQSEVDDTISETVEGDIAEFNKENTTNSDSDLDIVYVEGDEGPLRGDIPIETYIQEADQTEKLDGLLDIKATEIDDAFSETRGTNAISDIRVNISSSEALKSVDHLKKDKNFVPSSDMSVIRHIESISGSSASNMNNMKSVYGSAMEDGTRTEYSPIPGENTDVIRHIDVEVNKSVDINVGNNCKGKLEVLEREGRITVKCTVGGETFEINLLGLSNAVGAYGYSMDQHRDTLSDQALSWTREYTDGGVLLKERDFVLEGKDQKLMSVQEVDYASYKQYINQSEEQEQHRSSVSENNENLFLADSPVPIVEHAAVVVSRGPRRSDLQMPHHIIDTSENIEGENGDLYNNHGSGMLDSSNQIKTTIIRPKRLKGTFANMLHGIDVAHVDAKFDDLSIRGFQRVHPPALKVRSARFRNIGQGSSRMSDSMSSFRSGNSVGALIFGSERLDSLSGDRKPSGSDRFGQYDKYSQMEQPQYQSNHQARRAGQGTVYHRKQHVSTLTGSQSDSSNSSIRSVNANNGSEQISFISGSNRKGRHSNSYMIMKNSRTSSFINDKSSGNVVMNGSSSGSMLSRVQPPSVIDVGRQGYQSPTYLGSLGTGISLGGPTDAKPMVDVSRTELYLKGQKGPCNPPFFNFGALSTEECIRCFCFGQSVQCFSSDLHVSKIALASQMKLNRRDDQYFTSVEPGAVDFKSSTREFQVLDMTRSLPAGSYYWSLPREFLGDRLTSYGGELKYTIFYDIEGRPQATRDPDVIISGNDVTLYYRGRTLPSPGVPTSISVPLIESAWEKTDGPRRGDTLISDYASREDLMMVLANVEHIEIRAAYDARQTTSRIGGVFMTTAVDYATDFGRAVLVEECSCPTGYTGRSCQDCASGFTRVTQGEYLGQCVTCNCHGHSNDCDRISGQCLNCKHNTFGPQCQVCADGYYGDPRRGTPEDCKPCPCPLTESPNQFSRTCYLDTDNDVTCAACPTGYEGRRCERCAEGYVGDPMTPGSSCRKTRVDDYCDPRGSLSPLPNPLTRRCQCKENVVGDRCDRCRENSFYLSDRYNLGCVRCFCMGVSRICQSTSSNRAQVGASFSGEDSGFTITDMAGNPVEDQRLSVVSNRGLVYRSSNRESDTYYWSLPSRFLGDKVTSYGGALRFNIRYSSRQGGSIDSREPLVKISGNDITLVHRTRTDVPPNSPTPFSVTLFEQNWLRNDGQPATREHLLMALADLDSILIRAAFEEDQTEAGIQDVTLDVAENRQTRQDRAYAVEQCVCPVGYKGLSCEDCDTGYTRSGGGLYLGLCEPCRCNGHSSECDSETGICRNCQHNVAGDYCDECAVGYYGDATRGSRSDCQKCPCPLTESPNQFSPSCMLDTDGQVTCTACPAGHTGRRCESCVAGYTGNPNRMGDYCKLGPIDTCDCDTRGTVPNTQCDTQSQQCQCKPYTQGRRCARCREGHFYLESNNPQGCLTCFCSGITNQCTSSSYYRETMRPQLNLDGKHNFVLLNRRMSNVVTDGFVVNAGRNQITFNQFEGVQRERESLFFQLPAKFRGDRVTSYGGYLRFTLEYTADQAQGRPYRDVDFEVISAGQSLRLYYLFEPALVEGKAQTYEILLREDSFSDLRSNTAPTRETFMSMLSNIEGILIRATYDQKMTSVTLRDVSMDNAVPTVTDLGGAPMVEDCRCPEGYQGLSCQRCAQGYLRVSDGRGGLDRCVRCNCNGHGTTCDPDTGRCLECQHNTEGDRCERCVAGYYGDATSGTSTDCRTCSCPLTIPGNQFSRTCYLADDKKVTCDRCPTGYTGRQCETCAQGYVGDPTQPGESCRPREEDLRPDVAVAPRRVEEPTGSTATFQCSVTGQGPFNVVWSRIDSRQLPHRAFISPQYDLSIRDLRKDDSGRYVCTATNAYGVTRAEVELRVVVEPGQVDVRDKPPKHCGPVCKTYCPYGFVLDKYGCPICECAPMPTECPGNSHIPVIPLQLCSPNDNECPAGAHCPMQPHGVSICCTLV